jgi:hypothetical protein
LFLDRYRTLYNYKSQNDDKLELKVGDMVYVMEKCDDGWYVGSSQRTGYFGTFPGNYVEIVRKADCPGFEHCAVCQGPG